MDIRKIDLIEPYLSTISHYFRLFYEKEPWGDYKGCDDCFGHESLANAPRFSKNEELCPQCKNPLGPFWSEARCGSALSKSNLMTGFFENNELKGWVIAKPISDSTIAIDYMGLDSKYRRRKPAIVLMKEAIHVLSLYFIKNYIPLLNQWATNQMLTVPIISLQIFVLFEIEAKNMGYKYIQSSTHKDAKNIFNALRSVGFRLTKKDLPNDRVLFTKKIG